MKQLIEKETFHDCNEEKIPSEFYQESSNYYMICGRFIAKKSVLSVNYIRTGSSGGRGAASNVYEFILSNGRRVSLSTPFYIQILGKVSPKFKEETEKRRYWSIFARARQSWIRAFYKQWVSNGNQPMLLLTDEEVVTDYKNQLIKYIMQKERR